MSGFTPVALYGLKVPPGDVMIPSLIGPPANFRITMAAMDPSAEPEHTGSANGNVPARATLKIIYSKGPSYNDEDSDVDSEGLPFLKALLGNDSLDEEDEEEEEEEEEEEDDDDDDDESSSDDEEANGGPSDPSKSKKARKQAALEEILQNLAADGDDDEMDVDGINGSVFKDNRKNKGKGRASEGSEDSSEADEDEEELEEVVVCTLDPQKNYQQPLDLTISRYQHAYFKVSGTHAIYLSGNYLVQAARSQGTFHDHDEDEGYDYDLSPDESELNEDEESDELDDLQDPRITELNTDDEVAPKLVKSEPAEEKSKNKRAAQDSDDEAVNLDDLMSKALKPEPNVNGEQKLSKKQLKKLKNNAGQPVAINGESKTAKKEEREDKGNPVARTDKKVQFAKNLEQGPTVSPKNSTANVKTEAQDKKLDDKKLNDKKLDDRAPNASLGLKTLQGGVKIDDKKLGKGPACKQGDRVGMRYIGKLMDGKIFDANKKGKPFSFKVGTGEVIKGWDIGVTGMSVGGERRIEIPANLAYGSKSMPGIPANSPLKFDVKLLEIK